MNTTVKASILTALFSAGLILTAPNAIAGDSTNFAGKNPSSEEIADKLTPEDRRAIYRNVKITGQCRGTDDDPLVAAILTHQRAINHPEQDGRVSVAHGSGQVGNKAFFVLRVGARLANMFPDLFPRLDLMPGCPPDVIKAVRSAIPRV